MKTPTWIELSRSRLKSNLEFLRRAIGSESKFCSVVKGDAYGHCIESFVPMLEEFRVKRVAVSSADEAFRVRQVASPKLDIMILGHLDTADMKWAVEQGISFYVFDLRRVDAALRTAKKVGTPARIHLEVETGLFRTGLTQRSLRSALQRAAANPEWIRVKGICTHLCGAESSANYLRIQSQLRVFRERQQLLPQYSLDGVRRHVACSAAIFNYPESVLDLVRVGIAQYGFWPSEETRMSYQRGGMASAHKRKSILARVMCWKSRVMSITRVPAGAFVGYGLSSQANRRMQIAVIPVGYAHGFPREHSNSGRVLIRGTMCNVVGTVNMNAISVDVTDLDHVRIGEEVVIIGEQGGAEISVGSFGERTHELNYEVLARLSAHIPRLVVD